MSTTLSATTPLAERAKELVPLLDAHAPYADANSQLAPEVVDAYLETGLLKMWVPVELGGYELGPRQSLEVLALTSYGDPSAGWEKLAPQTSRITVTGPSLTRATCISVRKRPAATSPPSSPRRSTTAATSGSACSGRAAAIQLGRRPALVSP